jgi:hypothetical protein
MDKPASMSLTDFFTKKTAVKTLTSESIVDAVIKHQWKSANEAVKTNNEIEISGIGRFYVSKAKVRKRLIKLEEIQRAYAKIIETSDDEKKVNSTKLKLASITERINNLKNKLDAIQS